MKKAISSHALGAKNIKAALQAKYPGIKFTVRSESYAGGDSIRAGWELGPTDKEVDAIVGRYQEGHFDGMIDLYEYNNDPKSVAFQDQNGSAKYVFANRDIPEYVYEVIIKKLCEYERVEYVIPHYNLQISGQYAITWVHRILAKQSFPAGAIVTGIKRTNCDCGLFENFWEVTFDAPVQESAKPLNVESVTIRKNEDKGGIEVIFPAKPEQNIIDTLKGVGFRWSRFGGLWWSKYTEDKMTRVQELLTVN